MTARIVRLEPSNRRLACVRDLPTQRTAPLTRRFLDTLTPAVEHVGGYRWVGGGHNWRLDDSMYGITFVDRRGANLPHWVLYGGALPDVGVQVADPRAAVDTLVERGLIPPAAPAGEAS